MEINLRAVYRSTYQRTYNDYTSFSYAPYQLQSTHHLFHSRTVLKIEFDPLRTQDVSPFILHPINHSSLCPSTHIHLPYQIYLPSSLPIS